MSTILLIVICGKRVTILSHHYRVIEKLLHHAPCEIHAIKTQMHTKLDAGYILIDCNAQLIVNAQIAIQMPTIEGYNVWNAL